MHTSSYLKRLSLHNNWKYRNDTLQSKEIIFLFVKSLYGLNLLTTLRAALLEDDCNMISFLWRILFLSSAASFFKMNHSATKILIIKTIHRITIMALSMTEPKAFSLTYVLNGTVNSPSINVYFSESLVMVLGLSFELLKLM